ncbi:unnamed protein product [Thlaspi arvense]|uniref:AP2/ERF domain-containing protein n=1 Tax=Thlaspi arvense TaxID=13288 RepID=A0AAU9R5G2_THLAR|nr:unnamed protein product [Thlaspi arvense]
MMNSSCTKPKRDTLMRKVRIVVSDPYATDDSSSDEWIELVKSPKVKRIVHEVYLPSQLSQSCLDRCNGVEAYRKKSPTQYNKPVGIRQRKSGKWSAEIRNPTTKTRTWLGTYETLEDAEKAYADKKVEYDALASSCPAVSSSVASVNSQCLSSPSPPSVSAPCVSLSKAKMSLKEDVAACGDSTKEVLCEFSDLEIPDLSFLAGEEESTASGANGAELDFDCLLTDEDSRYLLDDFSLLDDGINISGFENSDLPDYDFTDGELELDDFKFVFADQLEPPLNIACP